jgi:hypothetical protein
MWVYFALTVLSTLYFGWHYVSDVVAGAAIAVVSVWLGALATGQRFDRHGRGSHPTTSTASVPVGDDQDDDWDDERHDHRDDHRDDHRGRGNGLGDSAATARA